MRKIIFIIFALLGLQAITWSAEPLHVRAALVSEVSAISDQPFWVQIKLNHDPEWHSYWKNPGDSGMATRVTWQLPKGFKAGPLVWPTPKRIEAPPLTSFGYDGETMFLTEITPPAHLSSNEVQIKAVVNWLECKEACYPGKASLELSVPVSKTSHPNPAAVRDFAKARFALPLERTDWKARGYFHDHTYSILLDPSLPQSNIQSLVFFPSEAGLIENAAPQALTRAGTGWRLDIPQSSASTTTVQVLKGVLVASPGWRGADSESGWQTDVSVQPAEPPVSTSRPHVSVWLAILLAFIGGIILNVMPCVLPVLAIKILGLAKQGEVASTQRIVQALFYGLGVLITFWVLAGSIFALKAGGHRLGWGFQLQSPVFVTALAYLFFLLTLNLFGVFEVGTSLIGIKAGATRGHFVLEPLTSGILAAVVATPCTAPFMGAALGFALAAPVIEGFAVFTALAMGMALPFMVLMIRPAGLALLPKPGAWMETLKRFLGLILLGTTIWLVTVLFAQDSSRIAPFVTSLVPIGVAVWVYGKIGPLTSPSVARTRLVISLVLALIGLGVGFGSSRASVHSRKLASGHWEPYSEARVNEWRAAGRPVFIDFTATWCLTCQVNQKVALEKPEVLAAFRNKNVGLLLADWTSQDEAIAQALEQYGRSGVPTYVLLPADKDKPARLLPEVLTPKIILKALEDL